MNPPELPTMKRLVSEVLTKIRSIKRMQWTLWALLVGALLVIILTMVVGVSWLLSVAIALVGVFTARHCSTYGIPSNSEVIARLGEQNPELKYLLATAHQTESQGSSSYLAKQVVSEAVYETISKRVAHNYSADILSKLTLCRLGAIAVFVIAAIFCLAFRPAIQPKEVANDAPSPKSPANTSLEIQVTPGDVEVEKESRLVITALFPKEIPDSATLLVECLDGEFVRRLPMKKKLADPEFGVSLESIPGDGHYRIETSDGKLSENFKITTYELPELVQSDAKVLPPEASARESSLTEDTYLARVFEGDSVEWYLQLNKPVKSGKLVAKDGREIQLQPSAEDPTKAVIATKPEKSERYELILEDEQGRANRNPPYLSVLVKRNLPSIVKLKFPTIDTRVTPIQEIAPEADLIDDQEIKSAGVTFRYQGEVQEIRLDLPKQEADIPLKKHRLRWPLDFETLAAKPNSLLTYHFWAEDEGPKAEMRRTKSDMYFIEVRHFEEIFREGPPKKAKGKGPSCESVLKLQKELINANWKLMRRQPKQEQVLKDGKSLSVMQNHIINLVDQLLQLVKDEVMRSILYDAREAMVLAHETLEKVANEKYSSLTEAHELLESAMEHEQTAYERLMQALSREFCMCKVSGESEAKPKRQSKQAMNLKLSQKEREYNEDRKAAPEPAPIDEELAMHYKRMLDLAKRQEAVTEQLKQLLASLETTHSPEEKADIERKLKRLREEQREMLTDIDKMLEKLDRIGRSEELAETMDALEKARKQASEASKAMSENNLAKAQNASKRAEEDMNKSSEELRKSNASQFAAHMKKLRENADKLAENQAKLTEKLANQAQSNKTSKKTRQQHEKEIRKQQKHLADVLDKMRDLTQASEDQESLLSNQLYEAIRNIETKGTTENLDEAAKQVRRGAYSDASDYEAKAAENIAKLQQDIQAASDSVIGSETEALKRADAQLAKLIEELEKENPQGRGQSKNKSEGEGEGEGEGDSQTESMASKGKGKGKGKGQGEGQGEGDSQTESMASKGKGKGKSKGQGEGQGEGDSQTESMASKGRGKGKGKGQGEGQGEGDSQTESMASKGSGDGNGSPPANPVASLRPKTSKPSDQVIVGGNHGSGSRKLTIPGSRVASFLESFDQDTPVNFGDERPITGEEYKEWLERLKEVELMVDSPEIKRELTRVRLRSREFRTDFKRNSRPPEWDVVEMGLIKPLRRVRSDVQNEIARKQGDEQKVRIDRDPAPVAYRDLVEKYYEKLSSGK